MVECSQSRIIAVKLKETKKKLERPAYHKFSWRFTLLRTLVVSIMSTPGLRWYMCHWVMLPLARVNFALNLRRNTSTATETYQTYWGYTQALSPVFYKLKNSYLGGKCRCKLAKFLSLPEIANSSCWAWNLEMPTWSIFPTPNSLWSLSFIVQLCQWPTTFIRSFFFKVIFAMLACLRYTLSCDMGQIKTQPTLHKHGCSSELIMQCFQVNQRLKDMAFFVFWLM